MDNFKDTKFAKKSKRGIHKFIFGRTMFIVLLVLFNFIATISAELSVGI